MATKKRERRISGAPSATDAGISRGQGSLASFGGSLQGSIADRVRFGTRLMLPLSFHRHTPTVEVDVTRFTFQVYFALPLFTIELPGLEGGPAAEGPA